MKNLTRLINQIRSGDPTTVDVAIGELIKSYRPLLVRAIRYALEPGNSLRPFLTTNDILQSVNYRLIQMGNKAKGRDETQPEPRPIDNGFRFLIEIATNLVIDRSRKLPRSSQSQDNEGDNLKPAAAHVGSIDADLAKVLADPCGGPDQQAEDHEALQKLLELFAPEERSVVIEKLKGRTWKEIGGNWERRMQRRFEELRAQHEQRNNETTEQ